MNVLTPEQCHAIDESNGRPVRLIDPTSHAEYVLIRADVYERVRTVLADDSAYEAFAKVAGPHGWDDPEMDSYERYRPQP